MSKVIIQEVIPKLAQFSPNESFDKVSQTKRQEQSANRFDVQPVDIVCHVSGDMYTCRMKSKNGIMHPVAKDMALQAIKLWDVGPDNLNDVLLMTEIRFVTSNAAWPDSVFNQSSIAPMIRGLRKKLRAEGVPLPDLLSTSNHELTSNRKPKGRPPSKRGERVLTSYWKLNGTPTMEMIKGVQAHANSTVTPAMQ